MPTIGSARYPLLAALLCCLCLPALAATAPAGDDEEDEDSAPINARWAVSVDTEVDQQSNRNVGGEVGYAWTQNTSVHFAGNSVAYSEVPGNGFHAQGIELGAKHDFKRWSLDGTLARWQDSDIVTVEELRLDAELPVKPWTLGLGLMARRSGFDAVNVNTTVTLGDGTQLPVLAVSSCTMNNEGFSVRAAYAGDVWGGHVGLKGYEYKSAKCSFGGVTGLNALERPSKDEFVQLEAPLVAQLEVVGVRRIGRDDALLASQLEAGASWRREDFVVKLDLTRQKDYLSGLQSNTLAATGTADMGHGTGVDLVLGMTRGGGVVSGGFVGFAVRARF